MTNKLDDSAAKALDKITNAAEAVVAKLGTLAEKYGPEAIDAGLWVIRFNALSTLVTGIAALILCILALRYAPTRIRKAREQALEYARSPGLRSGMPDGDGAFAVGVGAYIVAAISMFGAACALLTPWTYVAIFEPKLWVAKRLLGL